MLSWSGSRSLLPIQFSSPLEDISSRDAEKGGAIAGGDAQHTDYAANNLLEIIDPDPGYTLRQLPYYPDSWAPEPLVEEGSTPAYVLGYWDISSRTELIILSVHPSRTPRLKTKSILDRTTRSRIAPTRPQIICWGGWIFTTSATFFARHHSPTVPRGDTLQQREDQSSADDANAQHVDREGNPPLKEMDDVTNTGS